MAAYQRPNSTRTRAAAVGAAGATGAARAAQQFLHPSMDDKLIIYGDGVIYGGTTYPSAMDPMTAAGVARHSSYTGMPNTPTSRVAGLNMQQQQQQPRLQKMPQYQGYMNQQQQQQQQQQPYQQQQQGRQPTTTPLQQQSLQQQQQQKQRQQQLQQAYNHWPFESTANSNNNNNSNNMGMFNGHANQPTSPPLSPPPPPLSAHPATQMLNNPMAYGQHTWEGYTVMSPVDPSRPYTFGMD